jgi:hypothetical protein
MVAAGRGGPFIRSALLCEKVLQERDGVVSYIRVIDRVTRTDRRTDAPETLEPFQHSMFAALSFVSGDARGRHTVVMEIEPPSGLKKQIASVDVQFEGGNKAAAIAAQINITLDAEGVHWIHVLLDGAPTTQIPLEVQYRRVPGAGLGQQQS